MLDLGLVADINSGAYKFTKALHIFVAIVGIGTVFLNGLYGRISKAKGQSGAAAEAAGITEANERVTTVAEWFIYAIPVFGIGLIFMSDDAWDFGQTWIWLSLVLYAIATTLSATVLQPGARRLVVLSRELADSGPPPPGAAGPPPQALEMDRVGQRVGATAGSLHGIAIVILLLMIWKPGV